MHFQKIVTKVILFKFLADFLNGDGRNILEVIGADLLLESVYLEPHVLISIVLAQAADLVTDRRAESKHLEVSEVLTDDRGPFTLWIFVQGPHTTHLLLPGRLSTLPIRYLRLAADTQAGVAGFRGQVTVVVVLGVTHPAGRHKALPAAEYPKNSRRITVVFHRYDWGALLPRDRVRR